jgi:cell division protein FtsB
MLNAYDNWIMDLLSKDNAKLKNENDQLKEMIAKFKAGEYSKEELIQEYQLLIDEEKKFQNKGKYFYVLKA